SNPGASSVITRLRLREARPKDIHKAETLAVRLETRRLADRQRGSSVRLVNKNNISDAESLSNTEG
ncbi:hypothetical protein ACJMK2_028903, partial [Sinanodonta woodiana]